MILIMLRITLNLSCPADLLEFTVHNRVNYFAVPLLDGVWHSVCLSWRTATGPDDPTGTVIVLVDGIEINQQRTLAGRKSDILMYAYNRFLFTILHEEQSCLIVRQIQRSI